MARWPTDQPPVLYSFTGTLSRPFVYVSFIAAFMLGQSWIVPAEIIRPTKLTIFSSWLLKVCWLLPLWINLGLGFLICNWEVWLDWSFQPRLHIRIAWGVLGKYQGPSYSPEDHVPLGWDPVQGDLHAAKARTTGLDNDKGPSSSRLSPHKPLVKYSIRLQGTNAWKLCLDNFGLSTEDSHLIYATPSLWLQEFRIYSVAQVKMQSYININGSFGGQILKQPKRFNEELLIYGNNSLWPYHNQNYHTSNISHCGEHLSCQPVLCRLPTW